MKLVGKFMGELKGLLYYIYLLQSSLEYSSHHLPLTEDLIVYRVISGDGSKLGPLYVSMIDEVIVWPSFTSTSTNRTFVIDHFITDEDSILFEIQLHPGAVAVLIQDCSAAPSESEYLIAASTGFKIHAVDSVNVEVTIPGKSANNRTRLKIPEVKMSYYLSWTDFDIDERPATVIIEGDDI
jgi:hypothetical protein